VGRSYYNLNSNSSAFHDDVQDWHEVIPPDFNENRPLIIDHADNHKVDKAPFTCQENPKL